MPDSEAIEALAAKLKHGDDQALEGLMERFGSPAWEKENSIGM